MYVRNTSVEAWKLLQYLIHSYGLHFCDSIYSSAEQWGQNIWEESTQP